MAEHVLCHSKLTMATRYESLPGFLAAHNVRAAWEANTTWELSRRCWKFELLRDSFVAQKFRLSTECLTTK